MNAMGGRVWDRRFKPFYDKTAKDWLRERQNAPLPGVPIPEELELTEDDLDFLRNFDVVKELLDGTCVM